MLALQGTRGRSDRQHARPRPAGPDRRTHPRGNHGRHAPAARRRTCRPSRPEAVSLPLTVGADAAVATAALPIAVTVALAELDRVVPSPCVLPLVPGFLGTSPVSPTSSWSSGVGQAPRLRRPAFVLGFYRGPVSPWGGGVGRLLRAREHLDLLTRIGGAVVIVLALVFLGVGSGIGLPRPAAGPRWKPAAGLLGAPLLGAAFALGWRRAPDPRSPPILALTAPLAPTAGLSGVGVVLGLPYSWCSASRSAHCSGYFRGFTAGPSEWVAPAGSTFGGLLLIVGLAWSPAASDFVSGCRPPSAPDEGASDGRTQERVRHHAAGQVSPGQPAAALPRKAWRQLTTMRTALVLLFLLAIAAVPGSMLPAACHRRREGRGLISRPSHLAPVLDRLRALSRCLHLRLVLGDLPAARHLLMGYRPRSRLHWHSLKGSRPELPAPSRLDQHVELFYGGDVAAARSAATEALRRRRFRVISYDDESVSAERVPARDRQPRLPHRACVVICRRGGRTLNRMARTSSSLRARRSRQRCRHTTLPARPDDEPREASAVHGRPDR